MYEQAIQQYLKKYGFGRFRPKAVLFDMDGVIYDSMPNHATAWVNSMSQFGVKMSREDAYRFEGMRGVETIKIVAGKQWGRIISDEESQEMYAVKCDEYSKCPAAPKMPGVEELMHKIKDSGMLICVVTGSGQHSLLDHLETQFPELIYKERIVCSFDVKRGKPQPDPYLMGLEKCGGLKPWEAIVVENAPLGVRAAVAAQIFTVAVNTGPLPDSDLSAEGANLIFPSMPDFRDHWNDLLLSAGTL